MLPRCYLIYLKWWVEKIEYRRQCHVFTEINDFLISTTNTLATKWHAVSTQYTATIYTQILNCRTGIFVAVVSWYSLKISSFFLQIDVASRACGWFLMYLQIDYLFNFVGCSTWTALSSTHDSKTFYFCFLFVNTIFRFRRYWPTMNSRCVR